MKGNTSGILYLEKIKFEIFESVPDLYLILSPELEIINASDAYLKATFTVRQHIIGRYVFDVFPDNPEVPDALAVLNLKSSLEKVLKDKKPHELDLQRYDVPKSGDITSGFEIKYWRASNTPVLNEDKEVEYIIHKVVDVTHEMENEYRFTNLFNQTTVGIAQADLSGKFTLINDRYSEIVGWKKEELYTMHMSDITHRDDLEKYLPMLQRTIQEGIPFDFDKRCIRADGSTVWVNINVSAVKGIRGEPLYISAVCIDLTQRKMVEKTLKENENRLHRIIQASNDGIWEWDFKNDTAWWNESYSEILGIDIPVFERSLRTLNECIHPEDRHLIPEALKAHVEDGKRFEIEFRIVTPSGAVKNCLCRGKAYLDEEGNMTKLSGTLMDITEHIQDQANLEIKNTQLTRINNDLDNFIYTASHDLKAPITNIEGLIGSLPEVVSEETGAKDEFHQIMEMVNQSIQRFRKTIEDLTDISKIQRNFYEEESTVNFSEVIEDVKISLRKEIETNKAILTSNLDNCPEIHYSKRNLRSIIYNLINNAIKYRSPSRQPYINITSNKIKDYILICVEDNGLGIDPAKINNIFGMFKRLHDHVEGSGVGLYIVKRIIENSGGKIEVESELGKGTKFKVYLKA